MKKLIPFILFSLCLSLFIISCNKEEKGNIRCFSNAQGVDIYLLESYETQDYSCQIKEETAIIKDKVFISYNNLISYNSKEFRFVISQEAKKKIMDIQFPVSGIAFAVVANKELIYTGYFWPGYSSQACNWTTIDPTHLYSGNELWVSLGYPGQGSEITDKRNDSRILNIFRRDGKLIE